MPADTGPDTTRPDPLDNVVTQLATAGPLTAAALAARLGIAYSTITPKLRRLEEDQRAERIRDPATGRTLWQAAPAQPTDTDGPVHKPAETAVAPPPATAAQPTDAPVLRRRRKPAVPTESPQPATVDPPPTTPEPGGNPHTTTVVAAGSSDGSRPRRPKGSIAHDVLGVLRGRPDDIFKVAELAAALGGTSAGAIANALHKLVYEGSVTQVCEKPASYQAA
jgi:hypothetical protein